jgi:hypothetical protein
MATAASQTQGTTFPTAEQHHRPSVRTVSTISSQGDAANANATTTAANTVISFAWTLDEKA